MNKLVFILLFFVTALASAQNGTIAGTIIDKDYNDEPVAFASIQVKGTSKGAQSDMDGKFTISISPGTYTLIVTFVGMQTVETPVTVVAGNKTDLTIPMTAEAAALDDIVITVQISREKEEVLLKEQQQAVEIKQEIGAQEMSRKGAGDVAAAVSKTTGVSKQEGSSDVYVRGLGDRYNFTSLNGLPLPSNNPFYKNIELGIFSTDIVQSVSIDKVMNVESYAEFAGANIDIVTKNYNGKGMFEVTVGSKYNSAAMGEDNFRLQDGPGRTGFYDTDIPSNPLGSYNFPTSWNPQSTNTPLGLSFGIRAGKRFSVGEDGKLGVFANISHDNSFRYINGAFKSSVTKQGFANKDFEYEDFSYGTNTTGILNMGYQINSANNITYNFLLINDTSQNHRESLGREVDVADENAFIRRSNFDRTTLLINQLLGSHDLSDRLDLKWGLAYNIVNNDTPDRMKNYLQPASEGSSDFIFNNDVSATNHRFFQEIEDNEIAANASLEYKIGGKEDEYGDMQYKGKLFGGYSARMRTVDFQATQFNFRIINNRIVDPNNLDNYFNQANFASGDYSISTFNGGIQSPNALVPQTYNGDQTIHAGFIGASYQLTEKLFLKGGLRAEYIDQALEYNTILLPNGETNFDTFQILPSLVAKYALNEKQNLRFGASKTYTLPQFRERAPFPIEDENENIEFGNPDLSISTDYNLDVKWEIFPKDDEVIAVTGFGKLIQDPINKLVVASSTNDFSYVNSGESAYAVGLELEARKNIFKREISGEENDLEEKLSFGANVSYLYTVQDFDEEKIREETDLNVEFTNEEGQLTGASPILVNGDISYLREFDNDKSVLATLSYNYYSERLYAIGTNNDLGNQFDEAVGTLDFILKTNLSKKFGISLSAKNLTNPTVSRFQEDTAIGDVNVLEFQRGIDVNLGLTFKF